MSEMYYAGVIDAKAQTEGADQIYWLLIDVGILLEMAKAKDFQRTRSP